LFKRVLNGMTKPLRTARRSDDRPDGACHQRQGRYKTNCRRKNMKHDGLSIAVGTD
jgi:hypothetical protein